MLWKRAFVLALVLLGVALCDTAGAATPRSVTISVTTVVTDPSDPFTSTGGVLCANGTVSTPFVRFNGAQSGTQEQIHVGKHFVCSNGTFDLLLRVTLDFTTADDSGTWSVVHGTGAYALLHGAGTITGTAIVPSSVIQDEYRGSMHID
ncbi:MAG TPA: hypothetical protein VFM43_08110 [Gaiellaceae bacterium]|nr:hypothetical protein [Gaiellaceae bacterium]